MDYLKQRRIVEKTRVEYETKFLPSIIGKKYHMRRGYGHAEFIIHGNKDKETWNQGSRNRNWIPVLLEDGKLKLVNHGGPNISGIVVERLGGYDGPPTLPDLHEILDEFSLDIEEPKENKTPEFPVRLHFTDKKMEISLPRRFGSNARIFFRDVAKAVCGRLYFQKINCPISGRSDSGQEIPIDNVGKWLWGTPGYKGHLTAYNHHELTGICEWPSEAPEIVHKLISCLKEQVESGNIPRDVTERWNKFFQQVEDMGGNI